jgi:ketopantoate reductase
MNEQPKNRRQEAIDRLQNDLFESAMSQRFIASEEGKYLINYITEVVSALTNQMINKRLDREEYIELRAKIDILRRLKQVLEAKADDAVINRLKDELNLAQSGE